MMVDKPHTVAAERTATDLLSLLELETVEPDLYRAVAVIPEERKLYGGQVAAQALRAAGHTVSPDRAPHSLHGYFLRPGDASRRTVFRVFRDRDGGSYSARRVVALQGGKVIFNMAASFHVKEQGLDLQRAVGPRVASAAESPVVELPRLVSFEGRAIDSPYGDVTWPTRFWARCTEQIGDDLTLHACALAYLSDLSSGLTAFDKEGWGPGSSIDHAVWFHRQAKLDDWVLADYVPVTVGAGRGLYTGSLYDSDGRLLASIAQESLYRRS